MGCGRRPLAKCASHRPFRRNETRSGEYRYRRASGIRCKRLIKTGCQYKPKLASSQLIQTLSFAWCSTEHSRTNQAVHTYCMSCISAEISSIRVSHAKTETRPRPSRHDNNPPRGLPGVHLPDIKVLLPSRCPRWPRHKTLNSANNSPEDSTSKNEGKNRRRSSLTFKVTQPRLRPSLSICPPPNPRPRLSSRGPNSPLHWPQSR